MTQSDQTQQAPRPDANDVLMGGGGYPAIKFDQLRVWLGGTLVSKPTSRQETEFGTGKPKTFPKSGDPIYGLLVDVKTDQRTDNDDDGVRRMYIEGKRLKDAVREAVVAAGASGLEARGQLFVAWIGEEQGQGTTPAKVYEARYYPPTTPVPAATSAAGQPAPMPDPRDSFNGYAGHVPGPLDPPPAAPMPEPGNVNVFGQPATPAPAWAEQAAPAAQTAPQTAPAPQVTPPAPMAEPGAQSAAQEPTAEAVAALRAAGLDPRAVFPNYQG